VVLCKTKKITQNYTEKTQRTTEKNNLGNPENLTEIVVQTNKKKLYLCKNFRICNYRLNIFNNQLFRKMGLFSKILGNVIGDAIDKAKAQMQEHNVDIGQVKKAFSAAAGVGNQQPQQQRPQQQQHYQQDNGWKDVFVGKEGHTKEHFREILNSEFTPKYTIKEDVPVSEIGGNGRNYDFALYENDVLKGFIVVVKRYIADFNNWDNPHNDSKLCAEKANIPFINFLLHCPNKRDYVIDRINRLVLK